MNSTKLQPGDLDRHLRIMRRTTVGFLLTVPVAVVVMVVRPTLDSIAAPLVVTLVAALAALWSGFIANRENPAISYGDMGRVRHVRVHSHDFLGFENSDVDIPHVLLPKSAQRY